MLGVMGAGMGILLRCRRGWPGRRQSRRATTFGRMVLGKHGRWSDGSCRACPSGQVWRRGPGCVRAASRTSCSSGNTFFSRWNGCRPSSCPHGRTSTGHCRSAPVAAATTTTTTTRPVTTTAATTTTVQSTTTTTTTAPARPASCGNRGRRPDGTCRACPEPDEYHNGTECVKKTKPAPGDPKCSVAGEVYFSSYKKCQPASCEHGRASDGACREPPPAVPSGVQADGDSRSLYPTEPESTPVNGQILVSWSAVSGATSYVVGYALDATTLSWREQSVSGTSVTLRGVSPESILLNYLYHIRVKAVNSTGGSDWSKTVFSYPTYTPATSGDSVGIIPIMGYRPTARYDYVLCTNTAPVSAELNKLVASNPALTSNIWRTIIRDGVEIWDTKVEYITVGDPEIRRCTDEERDISDRHVSINLASLVPHNSGDDYCDIQYTGCAWSHTSNGQIGRVALYMRNNQRFTPISCSPLLRLITHESGHAFGLGDHSNLSYSSIMYNPSFTGICNPSEYDLGAIKAIYQSRSPSTTTTSSDVATAGMATSTHTTATTTTTTTSSTSTTVAATTTTVVATSTSSTTTTTTQRAQPVTVWQIETRPTRYDPPQPRN